jgi:flotillin
MPYTQDQVRQLREERGSRAGAIFGFLIWFIVSICLVAGPFVVPAFVSSFKMGAMAQLICMTVGIISLVLMSVVVVITKLYQKASANRALVRTGMGGIKVVLDGGILYLPVLHKLLAINLETMRLDVVRQGKDALITSDSLRADLAAQFYIKVQPSGEDITSAARSLGDRSVDEVGVKELVFDKLVSALRTVAAKSTLFDLNQEREKFAKEVKTAVEADLKHNGLTLESVTISGLDQTDVSALNEKNVFDAQGRKRIAQITQAANVERNELEREAEQQIKAKDVATRKAVLAMDLDQQTAEASQARDVANAKAEANRKAAEFKIQQDQAVAQADVERQRAVETSKIDAQKKLVLTNQERELADVLRQKTVETAGVEKQRTVEVATRDQQIAIAAKEAERAAAEAKKLDAEALRETAAQSIKTVEAVQSAERTKQQGVISASADAEKAYVKQQRDADGKAYELKALAEGKKAAAEAEAYAQVKAADAAKEAAMKRAEADTAVQTVPVEIARRQVEVERSNQMIAVDVAREQVKVKKDQVAVERQELEQREQFGRAALEFELSKLSITQEATVRIETARALSQITQKANMTIFGDPTTLSAMTRDYAGMMSVGKRLNGFFAGVGDDTAARKAVDGVVDAATGVLSGVGDMTRGVGSFLAHGHDEKPAASAAPAVPPVPVDPASKTPKGK